jgi:hypothetical protein
VWTPEEAMESCNQIGYPVMLKASWGGGGKGIRKVHSDEEVRQVFKQIQGEVRPPCPHSGKPQVCPAAGTPATAAPERCCFAPATATVTAMPG